MRRILRALVFGPPILLVAAAGTLLLVVGLSFSCLEEKLRGWK